MIIRYYFVTYSPNILLLDDQFHYFEEPVSSMSKVNDKDQDKTNGKGSHLTVLYCNASARYFNCWLLNIFSFERISIRGVRLAY
jgi:hypothetical protein